MKVKKQSDGIFEILKEKYHQLRILCLANHSSKVKEKLSHSQIKLREFNVSRVALQEMLKEVPQDKRKITRL